MRFREFPVFGDGDAPTVEAFATDLDRGAARVLAYPVGCSETPRGFLEGAMVGRSGAAVDPAAALDRLAGGDAVERNGWGWHPPEVCERLRVALEQVATLNT